MQPVISSNAAASSASIQIAIWHFTCKVTPPYPMRRQAYYAGRSFGNAARDLICATPAWSIAFTDAIHAAGR